MMTDPLTLLLAAAFTAGCAIIRAFRHRPDDVTLVLGLVLVCLVNLCGAVVRGRMDPPPETGPAVELIGDRPVQD
ncbi:MULTISPECIES: hypothetical protein [Methylobacterium]|uniref:hypothetical protein n=1 Tax=Methylobacterium TaxID=407 RepID=UPI0013EC4A3E|nr:hypothetical protein [Methylobacterium sp. DB0501]NGM34983.1 hypothetical protein [Methylobacterium sp. DB0501]